jgi:membrane-associated phospholipid phosphatase
MRPTGVSQPDMTGSAYGPAMRDAARRHGSLHAIAALSLLASFIIGARTGNRPDADVLQQFGFYILVALWTGGSAAAIVRLVWLAAVERHPSPLSAFIGSIVGFFGDPDRVANTVNGLAIVVMFFSAFGVLKGAIAILSPFAWDAALMEADRWLHFGRLPHDYLWWMIETPAIVQALNVAYNGWFVALIATVFTAVIARQDTALRRQFLTSFMAVWLVGGFLIALGFSSAGPCYYALIGLGDTYVPLMEALQEAGRTHTIWALDTQEQLWQGYVGARDGSAGISAFPSMHVALSVLFAIYFTRRSKALGGLFWLFAASIQLGSVVLGWHYAVDGYAGAAIAVLIWIAAGKGIASGRKPIAAG